MLYPLALSDGASGPECQRLRALDYNRSAIVFPVFKCSLGVL
jgi:hypothetical protein